MGHSWLTMLLVSVVPQSDSIIHRHVSILLQILFWNQGCSFSPTFLRGEQEIPLQTSAAKNTGLLLDPAVSQRALCQEKQDFRISHPDPHCPLLRLCSWCVVGRQGLPASAQLPLVKWRLCTAHRILIILGPWYSFPSFLRQWIHARRDKLRRSQTAAFFSTEFSAPGKKLSLREKTA